MTNYTYYIKSIINKLRSIIKDYKWTILLFIFILIIGIYPIGLIPRPTFILGSIFVIITLYIISKIKYNFILLFITSLIISIEAIYSFGFSTSVGVDEISFLFETNLQESKEMLGHYILLILFSLGTTFSLIFLANKELKKLHISFTKILPIVIIIPLILVTVIQRRIILNNGSYLYTTAPVESIHHYLRYYSPSFYTTLISASLYAKSKRQTLEFKSSNRELPQGINFDKQKQTDKKIPNIYVVIGESAFSEHLSIYGYKVKTTPFLDSLVVNSNLISYWNSYSGSSSTMTSVPMLLTTSNGTDNKRHLKEKHILELNTYLGYNSYWLSSQSRSNIFELTGASMITNIALTANRHYFIEAGKNPEDLDLVTRYKKSRSQADENKLVFFHLIGSHLPYEARSDENDSVIDSENPDAPYSIKIYDRSIHHTDRFLRNLWNEIKDEKAILIYTSDHGETVGKGHGGIRPQNFKVPFIVINTSDFDINSVIESYLDQDRNYLSNTTLYYILLELMGAEVNEDIKKQATRDAQTISVGGLQTENINNILLDKK